MICSFVSGHMAATLFVILGTVYALFYRPAFDYYRLVALGIIRKGEYTKVLGVGIIRFQNYRQLMFGGRG